jgi:hypothetical protein
MEAPTATVVGCWTKASFVGVSVTVNANAVKLQICVAVFTAVVQLK